LQETLFVNFFLKIPLKGKEQEWKVETLTKMGLTILRSKIPNQFIKEIVFTYLGGRKENGKYLNNFVMVTSSTKINQGKIGPCLFGS